MKELVKNTWANYESYKDKEEVVSPGMPILYFGDLEKYKISELKIITVALNPSLREFPALEPFSRFPDIKIGNSNYLKSLNSYFQNKPYKEWFRTYEKMINQLNASYYSKRNLNTALHTDICTTIPTSPPWSGLDKKFKNNLIKDGYKIWSVLIGNLSPDIVIMSFAKKHLSGVTFFADLDFKTFYKKPTNNNYIAQYCWASKFNKKTLFIFGSAGVTPFQPFLDAEKTEILNLVKDLYRSKTAT